MSDVSDPIAILRLLALGGGFLIAVVADLRDREIDDRLWQTMGILGVVLGGVDLGNGGLVGLLLWLMVGAFALEHLFPWDELLSGRTDRLVLPIEVGTYLAVVLVLASAVAQYGLGAGGVPIPVVAVAASVVLARALFETGVLYGGADAKAVIVAGVVLPVLAAPVWGGASFQDPVLGVLPFTITVLTNAAVLSLAIPIAIAVRNVQRGEFEGLQGFTRYTLPVELLARRFVWVRDDALGEDGLADDVETSEEDVRRRAALARRLRERGIRRVWVSPQIPFIVLIALGALTGVLAGNLLLDVFSLAAA